MSRAGSATIGVVVGGAVGAIAALLLAPKRGEELRSDVMNWTRDAEHKAAEKLRHAGSKMASGIRQMPQKVSEKAPQVVSAAKGMFQRGAEHTAEGVEQSSEMAAEKAEQHAEEMPHTL
ncbi:MAG: YtxH domain-containing protein [Armatimonadetes bacterium]|jgi:gas vesicle protein|nr:YtxH domain-containing protein [Armatimonadota bacterium]